MSARVERLESQVLNLAQALACVIDHCERGDGSPVLRLAKRTLDFGFMDTDCASPAGGVNRISRANARSAAPAA
jgi:hypothetical protein